MSFCNAPRYPDAANPQARARARAREERILARFLDSLARAESPRAASTQSNGGPHQPQSLGDADSATHPNMKFELRVSEAASKGTTYNGLLDWSLNSLAPGTEEAATPTPEELLEVIPFRNVREKCSRSFRCCGVCTHQCTQRCLQDCLTRMYMWARIPEESQPLAVRMLLIQADAWKTELLKIAAGGSPNSYDDICASISWTVGDIISRKANREVRAYMDNAEMRPEENPYKIDYGPLYEMEVNPKTQKLRKKVDKDTGRYVILEWPKSGMCPFCLPNATYNRRYVE